MPLAVLLALSAICPSGFRPSPVGTYRPDLSRAPRASLSVLKTVFGSALLRVSPDGRFSLCGIRQTGFWRIHQGRLVLVNEGFMGSPFAVPDEQLKRTWPGNGVSGLVLSLRSPNRLELPSFGRVAGPISFVRQPSRATRALIVESRRDEMDAVTEEAYMQLSDELPTRWREVRAAINDPKFSAQYRSWAALIWHGPATDEVASAMAELCEELKTEGLTERQAGSIRRAIGRNLSKIATNTILSRVLALESKGFFSRTDVAEAIARTQHHEGEAVLIKWLQSRNAYDRGAACEALAKLGAKDALPSIRPLAKDVEAQARIGALAAIAQLSTDPHDRESAIGELAKELRGDWLDACSAAEALGVTKSRLAVKPLVGALAGENVFVRRVAAEQLGALGFAEAIPALLEAKGGSPSAWVESISSKIRGDAAFANVEKIMGRSMEDAPVRKAAAEALWLFDKRRKRQSLAE